MECIQLFEKYLINYKGEITNIKTNKPIKVTNDKAYITVEGKSKQITISKIIAEHNLKEDLPTIEENDTVNNAPKTGFKRTKPIIVKFINGDVKEYPSCARATQELNIKHRNAISGYWIKGKCKKAMESYNIQSIEYK